MAMSCAGQRLDVVDVSQLLQQFDIAGNYSIFTLNSLDIPASGVTLPDSRVAALLSLVT
jgi:hypothetical protein